jgi:HK97 family phage major capsid protein
LGHGEGEVDLSFIGSGNAPFLVGHNQDDQIGVVDSVDVADGRGTAIVRLGKAARAQEMFTDIVDGIRSNISVGYIVNEIRKMDDIDGVPAYRATKWTPMEISLVSVPADRSVGVGRSSQHMENTTMTEETKVNDINIELVRNETREAEQMRVRTIYSLGDKFNSKDLADKYVKEGKSVDDFRGAILDTMEARQPLVQPITHLDLSPKEQKRFSLARAVRALISKDFRNAGFELECSDEISKRLGRPATGILVPADYFSVRAPMGADATTYATTGEDLVGTDHLGGEFINPLYNKTVIRQAGARILPGLVGNVDIPKGGSATAYWLSTEETAITESTPATSTVSLSPKTVGGLVQITRRLMQQSDPTVETFIRNDLLNVLSVAVDTAALWGTGLSGQPTGIANTSGVGSVSMGDTVGGAPTWAKMLEFWSAVEAANLEGAYWITNPKVVAKLMATAKVSSTDSVMIMQDISNLLGYPVLRTNSIPSTLAEGGSGNVLSGCIFGDFSQVLIGEWSVIELSTSDSHSTNFTSGIMAVRAMTDIDIAVRYPGAFAVSKDIITA